MKKCVDGIPVTVDTTEEEGVQVHIIKGLEDLIVVGLTETVRIVKNTHSFYLDLFGLDILKVVFSAKKGELDGAREWGCGYLIGKF